MGLMDNAKKFADEHKDQVAKGVDKATDAVDDKTGGKHSDRLGQVDDAAAKYAGADESASTESSEEPDQPA